MLFIFGFFLFTFVAVLLCVALGLAYLRSQQKQQIRSMLKKAEETPIEQRSELVRPADEEGVLTTFLRRFRFMDRLELMIEQAGKDWSGTKFVVFSAATGLAGLILGAETHFIARPLAAALLGAAGASIPLLLVLRRRAKTFKAFEEQFPEALDFLSRSMRAGHGFSVALEMLSTDSPDPLASAFRRVSNDIQLGASLEEALAKLVLLMPLIDVRFFVSSVILQQETGGNLGEILSKLATIIRERFRVKGQVKAASAHGRITGLVLVLMPVVVAAFMMISTPGYLNGLVADKMGRAMLWGAAGGQVIGFFVIRKIVNIKV